MDRSVVSRNVMLSYLMGYHRAISNKPFGTRVGRIYHRYIACHESQWIQTVDGLLGELVGLGWFTQSINSVNWSPNPSSLGSKQVDML